MTTQEGESIKQGIKDYILEAQKRRYETLERVCIEEGITYIGNVQKEIQ